MDDVLSNLMVMGTQTGSVDKEFKTQPADEASQPQGSKNVTADQFNATRAHPGPAVPQSMPEQEGSKEERQAKAKELNK